MTRTGPRVPGRLASLCLLVGLGACAAPPQSRAAADAPAHPMGQAATAPLSDLNLLRTEVPKVLIAAQVQPYGLGADRSCAALAAEVLALDAALGPDLDGPDSAEASLGEQGAQAIGDAAVGAVRGAAEGVLPFRGWLRKLSGAERRDREQAAALAAGTIRRAFLKGHGQALGCAPPAAPWPDTHTKLNAPAPPLAPPEKR